VEGIGYVGKRDEVVCAETAVIVYVTSSDAVGRDAARPAGGCDSQRL
jgi:hypothetical protein